MQVVRAGCAAVLLVAVACSGAPRTTVLESIETGVLSGVSDRSFRVIGNGRDFVELYRRIHAGRLPPREPPSVEFTDRVIVVGFMGGCPTTGYTIGFDATVKVVEGAAIIRVIEDRPAPGTMQGAAMTAPYAIGALARGDYDIVRLVDSNGESIATVALKAKPITVSAANSMRKLRGPVGPPRSPGRAPTLRRATAM